VSILKPDSTTRKLIPYRDEAMRETRKLQADILSEREKVKTLMAQA